MIENEDYKNIVWFDCSDNDGPIDFTQMPNVTDVCVKFGGSGVSQKTYVSRCQAAHSASKRVHGYYWPDPLEDPEMQALHFLKCAETVMALGILVHSLTGDVEQYWKDWALWKKYNGTPQESLVPVFKDKEISDSNEKFFSILDAHTSILIMVYSANWFIAGFSPSCKKWMPKYYGWFADYQYSGDRVETTWQKLQDQYQPKPGWIPTSYGVLTWYPREKLALIQWTGDKFLLPGVWSIYLVRKSAIDASVYRGILPFNTLFGIDDQTTPSYEDQPVEETKIDPIVTLEDKVTALNIPYRSQLDSGALKYAKDCGAADGAMIAAGYTKENPTVDEFYNKTGVIVDQFLSFSQVQNVLLTYGIQSNYEAGVSKGRIWEIISSNRPAMCLIKYEVFLKAGLAEENFSGFHFVLVVGITTTHVIIHDSLYHGEGGKYKRIPVDIFMQAWKEAGIVPTENPSCAMLYPVPAIGDDMKAMKVVQITASDGLKIRSEPKIVDSPKSNKVGALKNGATATVIFEKDGWYNIGYGWISAAYTKPVAIPV